MKAARDPWWIIGSAAVALHGADGGDVRDVDVLLSPADADRLPLRPEPTDDDPLFRSERFLRWSGAALPVECMAGFAVRVGEAWQPVLPSTRIAVDVERATLFAPSRDELKALLMTFGRPKDLARAARL